MKHIRKVLSKEFLLYLLFGGCSFLLNIILYEVFAEICGFQTLTANLCDWIITMVFVFCTNERWVFTNSEGGRKTKIIRFIVARTATLLLEEICLYVFIDRLNLSGMTVKICVQIIVIIVNYILSRMWIFKRKTDDSISETDSVCKKD